MQVCVFVNGTVLTAEMFEPSQRARAAELAAGTGQQVYVCYQEQGYWVARQTDNPPATLLVLPDVGDCIRLDRLCGMSVKDQEISTACAG